MPWWLPPAIAVVSFAGGWRWGSAFTRARIVTDVTEREGGQR